MIRRTGRSPSNQPAKAFPTSPGPDSHRHVAQTGRKLNLTSDEYRRVPVGSAPFIGGSATAVARPDPTSSLIESSVSGLPAQAGQSAQALCRSGANSEPGGRASWPRYRCGGPSACSSVVSDAEVRARDWRARTSRPFACQASAAEFGGGNTRLELGRQASFDAASCRSNCGPNCCPTFGGQFLRRLSAHARERRARRLSLDFPSRAPCTPGCLHLSAA
jgi:hypothetical protein